MIAGVNRGVACTLPLSRAQASALTAGDMVLLSGVLYTARDAAHKRFMALLDRGEALPFPLEGACIYYAGPAPARDGQIIGSAGPTTSYRMDAYTPRLLELGLRCMIGKGDRSDAVTAAMKKVSAVYFAALGGAGALLASRVTSSETIAFPDLGAEAVRRLTVHDFPAVTAIDGRGNNLYTLGPERYAALG